MKNFLFGAAVMSFVMAGVMMQLEACNAKTAADAKTDLKAIRAECDALDGGSSTLEQRAFCDSVRLVDDITGGARPNPLARGDAGKDAR